MATYNLKGKYETILSQLSNDLSIVEKKRISKREVLEKILDIVIEEERLFSTREQPVSFLRRNIVTTPNINNNKVENSQELLTRIKSFNNDY